MKKLLFLSFFSFVLSANTFFEIKEQTNDKIKINFNLQDYEVKNNQNGNIITVPGSGTRSVSGEPALPSLSSFVILDKNATYDIEYNILSEDEIQDIYIAPQQSFDTNNKKFLKNNQIYSSNTQFPSKNLIVSERQNMRGYEFVNLEFVPFSYNPIEKRVNIYKEVEIVITKINETNNSNYTDFPKSKVFERLINAMALNPISTNTRNEDYQKPSILYICGGSTESNPYFQQLVKWRRKQGYIVYTANTSDTGGSSTTAIKNYIQGSMNWDVPPEFVTLIGDDGGTYNIDSYTEYDSGYNGEGDHPYSQLIGNDLWPEVILGRISVRSSSELAVVVSKILGYEQVYDDSQNWHEKAALVGDPSTSGISCAITAENIAAVMDQYGVEDIRTKISGGSYDSWMVNQLDEGVNFFNYRGYYGVSGFSNSDVDAANNGFKLPFATVITCGTGSFASETQCLSEKFLRAGSTTSPKGAVACIGTATVGTHTMFNNSVNIGIYYGLFAKDLETAGEGLVYGKANLYENYPSNPNDWVTIFTHWNNLMGDGATRLWTDTPEEVEVVHQSTLSQGENFLSFNITNLQGAPVEGALVTLMESRTSDYYLEGISDSEGNVVINLDQSDVAISDDLEVTITKFNHKPYMGEIQFQENSYVPYASLETSSFNDSNSNEIMNPGETIQLTVPIHYDGDDTFNNVTATLYSDSDINPIFTEVYYGNISNGTNYPEQAFVFQISEFENHNSNLNLYINLSNNYDFNSVTNLNYNIESFQLSVESFSVLDGGNNILDPGESANGFLTISNSGTLSSPVFNCSVTTLSPDLVIDQQSIIITEVSSNNSNNSSQFEMNLETSAFNGETKILDFSCSTEYGYEFEHSEDLQVGTVRVTDPVGPDEYGYYIYDSNDSDYSLKPTYEWIDIQDIGTPLNTVNDDDGDNQDDSQVINLPFTFKFYGQEYQQITVCSNGWISFGSSQLESFRNDHLPGPGGPSPMLAVFWDDLTADNGGAVYSYYDEQFHFYVVQWNNVKTYEDNSNESFQAILFDPMYYITPTGDGEILLQYEDFNNTSNGSYGGGTPLHGGYCSIGIEDHWGTTGLEYTFNNTYDRAAMPLSDETALFISTRKTGSVWNLPQAQLELSNNELNVEVEENQVVTNYLTLTNSGEEESILSYNINTSPLAVSAGNDDFGNHWIDSDLDFNTDYSWVEIEQSEDNRVVFQNNDDGEIIEIGFDFNYYGQNYSQLVVNPNGWVGFGENDNQWSNETIPTEDAPQNAIFAFWDDLNPENENNSCSNEGQGRVYHEMIDDKKVIWFNDIVRCGSNPDYEGMFDFQVVLHKNKMIDINYRNMDGYTTSATIGIQNSNGSDGIQIVYNDDYVHENLRLTFKPNNQWLAPINDSNTLSFGEQAIYDVQIDSNEINSQNEVSYILIESNSSQPNIVIPVNVSFIDNTVVGDINGDEIINVLDVVIIVNMIVSNAEYMQEADLNDDSIVNVLDIVLLVNLILNS